MSMWTDFGVAGTLPVFSERKLKEAICKKQNNNTGLLSIRFNNAEVSKHTFER